MAEKRNIFLVGPMGAGKSTIGRQLAQQLNLKFFDSDKEIERSTGVDIGWVFDLEGENSFRNREERIINELTKKRGIILATGGGSVKMRETQNLLTARGVVVYLTITIEKQLARTKYNKHRPLLQQLKVPTRDFLEELARDRDHLYKKIADITISTDKQNTKIITNRIINILTSS
ncbi:shikimate kinase AroK [Candidatus Hoaglandella endobia]|uniref:Shikimate kinase 1 n=1 Tax=Candidatus Hoaglandella endobia TaxID=1778263 RepID=A0A143WU25_9ENTR|nr:shikimate kinase AroK [Candidatus Hoaglandella endobia]CUX97359.1 Shikimate kinase 1 [Candidatus Hoaglandella endobia]